MTNKLLADSHLHNKETQFTSVIGMIILISSLILLFIICTYPFISFLLETLLQTNLAQNVTKLFASGSTLLAFKNTLIVSGSVCIISILSQK